MYIFDLNYPGTQLQFEDEEVKREIESMIRNIEGIVTEAAISLSMFESCREQNSDSMSEWERSAELKQQIDNQIKEEVGEDYFKNFDRYQLLSEKRLRARKAELGILPSSYIHKIPFMHAHGFVYALDSFGKFLEEFCKYEGIPEQVKQCYDEFNFSFPSVRKIRNSALHIEDRVRGYGTWKDKKQGKKMSTNGFLGLSNLENNHLCYTIDDGSYQRVEINQAALDVLVKITNDLLTSFQWVGSPNIGPRY